jgi:ABC-type branched-subunit amino acid transport system ATPase component/ABC-type branched-subunit amino acid transport system permease subunit
VTQILQFGFIGLSSGAALAIVALGVVVIYRGSGVLNLAQGAIGTVGAYVFWELQQLGWPVWADLVLGILAGALISTLVYAGIIRFMAAATDVSRMIATLGVLLVLQGVAAEHFGADQITVPPFIFTGSVELFGAVVTQTALFTLVLAVLGAIACAAAFRWTRLGRSATALRENGLAAQAIGISPHPTGIATWSLGGGLGALAAIMLLPVTGLSPSGVTTVLIPALAAALLARFQSTGVAVAAGLAIGVVEGILLGWQVNGGLVASVPFLVIAAALIVSGKRLPPRSAVNPVRLPRLGTGRVNPVVMLGLAAAGVILSLVLSPTWDQAIIASAIAGILAVSVVIVTGYAGQLSLAPFALAGMGSLITAQAVSNWHVPSLVAIVAGVAAATIIGVIVGAPAVRVRGMQLAIVTLGLSLVIENAVLNEGTFTGGVIGLPIPDFQVFGLDLDPGSYPARFAIVTVLLLLGSAWLAANLRRGVSGRRFASVRSTERGAAALGISVDGAKLAAFAISSALAGLAGALLTFRSATAAFSNFDVFQSINLIAMTTIGGIGYLLGVGVPAIGQQGGIVSSFFLSVQSIEPWINIAAGAFVVINLLQLPDGVGAQLVGQYEWVAARLRRASRKPAAPARPTPANTARASTAPLPRLPLEAGSVLARAAGLTVRFGGTTALDDVSVEVRSGRILGVLGPNGAGKTTLIDALTGFVPLDQGSIELLGGEITRLTPHQRARRGLTRSFQNLELFDDLTVGENLLAALDRHRVSSYLADLVRPNRADPTDDARNLMALFGLDCDFQTKVASMPQGDQRLLAVTRAALASSAVLCLDEPAAGLTAPERRRLGTGIRRLASERGLAVLLIEHNLDVIDQVCDDALALNFGRVIAAGQPADVLADDLVKVAYLGEAPPAAPDSLGVRAG